jgi:hypothetical protein
MLEPEVLVAFGLTVFACLSTGIGSAIAFFVKKQTPDSCRSPWDFPGA